MVNLLLNFPDNGSLRTLGIHCIQQYFFRSQPWLVSAVGTGEIGMPRINIYRLQPNNSNICPNIQYVCVARKLVHLSSHRAYRQIRREFSICDFHASRTLFNSIFSNLEGNHLDKKLHGHK